MKTIASSRLASSRLASPRLASPRLAGLVLAAASTVLAMGAAQASDSARHEAQSLEKAKISLTDAIRIAEKQGNGQATSAEYESRTATRRTTRLRF